MCTHDVPHSPVLMTVVVLTGAIPPWHGCVFRNAIHFVRSCSSVPSNNESSHVCHNQSAHLLRIVAPPSLPALLHGASLHIEHTGPPHPCGGTSSPPSQTRQCNPFHHRSFCSPLVQCCEQPTLSSAAMSSQLWNMNQERFPCF